MRARVLAVVLTGGKGERREPLTRDRAKPAVPFGGVYRIIDFTLSNCLNSGMRRILIHIQNRADATVGVLRATREEASRRFGVLEVDRDDRIMGFEEKPVVENRKGTTYWRDVGTLDAYFEANMDLVATDPQLNLYDEAWPIRTYQPNDPPPKFVFAGSQRRGSSLDSIVCSGSIVSGGQVERSILGPGCRVNSYVHVQDSILFAGVNIGRHARIRRSIVDKGVTIPPGTEIGFDPVHDRARGFTVTESGLTIIPKADNMLGWMETPAAVSEHGESRQEAFPPNPEELASRG